MTEKVSALQFSQTNILVGTDDNFQHVFHVLNPQDIDSIHIVFFTGRNEVVAKVIFLHLSVILFTGGGGLPQCMLGCQPPQSRHLSQEQTPPPGKQTPAYGLRAAGTHPTGMHSCFQMVY